jgi:hypothetical protein
MSRGAPWAFPFRTQEEWTVLWFPWLGVFSPERIPRAAPQPSIAAFGCSPGANG